MTIRFEASSQLPTRFGDFTVRVFTDGRGLEHLALSVGTPVAGCLVRIHSECATGDIFGSFRCDCRDQLELALEKIHAEGNGLLVYLRGHEGRGIGLANKIRAYALQDLGQDTVDANISLGFLPDQRDYDAAIGILKYFGLSEIKLMSNNRSKAEALVTAGITVKEHVSHWTASNPHNADYLETKRSRMGHVGRVPPATPDVLQDK